LVAQLIRTLLRGGAGQVRRVTIPAPVPDQ
jgi:hypothetical protein